MQLLLSLHFLLCLGGDVSLLPPLHMHTLSLAQTLPSLELCFIVGNGAKHRAPHVLGGESLSPKVEWQCNPHYSESFIILICITDIKDLGENRASLTSSCRRCGLRNM